MVMTIALVNKEDVGDREVITLDCTGDASYPTGGYAFGLAEVPFRAGVQIEHVEGKAPSGRKVRFDPTNNLLLWDEPAGTEVVNATDLSAETASVVVRGR